MPRIARTLSATLWALWRCFPSSLRLAVYRWVQRRYGVAGKGIGTTMLPFGLVSKAGMRYSHYEAEDMQFVAQNTSIPVPRVLDAIEYTVPGGERSFGLILMTRLEGESLYKWISDRASYAPGTMELIERMNTCLDTNDSDGFDTVVAQLKALPPPTFDPSDAGLLIQDLRDAFKELRALAPPASPAVAGLSGGPVLLNRTGDCELVGPFEDQQDFKDFLFDQVNPILFAHRMPDLRRLAAPVNAKRHRTCFTHADLHARNVLVKDGRLAGILDWENAGWYPEYWELVSMEMQMFGEPLLHQFWDAVQLFGPEPYRDELTLEWALCISTGMTAVLGEAGDDLSCPRIKKSTAQAPAMSGNDVEPS